MPKRIILIRHGETEHNKQGKAQGWVNSKLNQHGIEQAKKLTARLVKEKIDTIYTSDLKRATDTIKETAEKLGLKLNKTKLIRERNLGIFGNKTWDDIRANFKELLEKFDSDDDHWKEHGGESRHEVKTRVKKFFDQLSKKHPDKTVLISTHGGTKKLMLNHLGHLSRKHFFGLSNASVTILEKDKDGTYQLKIFNDTSHLDE